MGVQRGNVNWFTERLLYQKLPLNGIRVHCLRQLQDVRLTCFRVVGTAYHGAYGTGGG